MRQINALTCGALVTIALTPLNGASPIANACIWGCAVVFGLFAVIPNVD